MIALKKRKAGTALGESTVKPSSLASADYGAPTPNCLRVLPSPSVTQLKIERIVSVMGITPQNLLICFELSDSVAEQLLRFEKMVRRCRFEFSEKAVHDVRVHCRRLIARLVLIEMAMSLTNLQATRKHLKRLLKLLGALRDVQVQKEILAAELPRHPEVGGLWIEIGGRERELIQPSSRFMSEFKMGKLRRRLEIIQDELKNTTARLATKAVLGESIIGATQHAFDEVMLRACAISPDDASTVHRVESLPPILGGPSEVQLSAMDAYQQAMGRIQDVDVLLKFLGEYTALRPEVVWSLASFKNALLERRSRLIQDFIVIADKLCSFWPIPPMPGEPVWKADTKLSLPRL